MSFLNFTTRGKGESDFAGGAEGHPVRERVDGRTDPNRKVVYDASADAALAPGELPFGRTGQDSRRDRTGVAEFVSVPLGGAPQADMGRETTPMPALKPVKKSWLEHIPFFGRRFRRRRRLSQTEFLMQNLCVIRNDLAESDVEVVASPAKPGVGKKPKSSGGLGVGKF